MSVNLTANSLAAGIGTGDGWYNGTSTIGSIAIMSGNIIANSTRDGSGIGTVEGYSNGTSAIGNLTIVGGNVTANSSNGGGSGIGTALSESGGISMIETLSTFGGRIRVNGTEAGIGSGFDGSEVKLLRFSGRVNLFSTVNPPMKFPINASSIVLSDTSLTITTPHARIFGVSPVRQGSLNLNLIYESVTSANVEPLSLLNERFIQIGNVSVPESDGWSFCVSRLGYENCFETESKNVKSLIFSVPSEGQYSIRGSSNAYIHIQFISK
jgi:hypothetical protein